MPESRNRKRAAYTPPPKRTPKQGNPGWLVPVMVTLMVVGLLWVVATYVFGADRPIPGLGNWNLAIGFGLMLGGFLLTLRWR